MKIIKLGRAQDNDYVVNNPAVSSYHADIYLNDDGSAVFVDHSTNGTMINNQFVHNTNYYLNGSELIVLPGGFQFYITQILGGWNGVQAYHPNTVVEPINTGLENSLNHTPQQNIAKENNVNVYVNQVQQDTSGNNNKHNHNHTNNNDTGQAVPKGGMSFGETFIYFFQHYADFSGRARRREYWYMVLWNFILSMVISLGMSLTAASSFAYIDSNPEYFLSQSLVWIIVYSLWGLVTFIPALALIVRRLHDSGKSGAMLLLLLIPVIGSFIILVFMLVDSQPNTNQYGPSPKYNND